MRNPPRITTSLPTKTPPTYAPQSGEKQGNLNGNSCPLPDVDHLPRFVRDVAAWYGLGYSLREIGANCGVTRQALSIMLVRQRERWKSARTLAPGELTGLSPRAVNCLGRLGITTRRKARQMADLELRLRSQRNCGSKTTREILDWASNRAAGGERQTSELATRG